MLQLRRISLCLCACLGLVYFANAQIPGLECPPITMADLGSATVFSEQGLLATSLDPGGEVAVTVPVRIMRFRTVCEATGAFRNTTSFVSVLVEFQCDLPGRTEENLRDCDRTTVLTRQYQYFCNQDNNYIVRDPSFVQTLQPAVDFDSELDTSCVRCINDRTNPGSPVIDADTHCEICPTRCLNRGLERCYREQLTDPCCTYYNDSRCVEECPSPLVGNSVTFDCECGQLSTPNSGSIRYSNNFAIGSVATHTCMSGYRRVGATTRTCTFSGWDGENVTCAFVQCPDLSVDNGMVSLSTVTPVLGTVATYICDDGYGLKGGGPMRTCQLDDTWTGTEPSCEKCTLVDESNPDCIGCTFDSNGNEMCICKEGTTFDASTGKCEDEATTGESSSSCSPGCIAGIVLAILGAIIMAIVVALVVYAVYSYLSNPATKLAKAGTEGLNGVARDNPLYLPPEEIVEDVDKVGDVEVA